MKVGIKNLRVSENGSENNKKKTNKNKTTTTKQRQNTNSTLVLFFNTFYTGEVQELLYNLCVRIQFTKPVINMLSAKKTVYLHSMVREPLTVLF